MQLVASHTRSHARTALATRVICVLALALRLLGFNPKSPKFEGKFGRFRFRVPSLKVMLVQEIPKASSGPPKKAPRGSALYARAALDSSAQQTRIARHLAELEQDNYHAIQIDIPKPERAFR